MSVRGYWGDIVCGPFAAFAVEADEERLYEKGSMQHKHVRAYSGIFGAHFSQLFNYPANCVLSLHRQSDLDVAEYNLTAMLVEFETGQKYRMPADKFAAAAPAPASADAGVWSGFGCNACSARVRVLRGNSSLCVVFIVCAACCVIRRGRKRRSRGGETERRHARSD